MWGQINKYLVAFPVLDWKNQVWGIQKKLKSSKAIHMKYIDKRLSFLFYEYVFKKNPIISTSYLKLESQKK